MDGLMLSPTTYAGLHPKDACADSNPQMPQHHPLSLKAATHLLAVAQCPTSHSLPINPFSAWQAQLPQGTYKGDFFKIEAGFTEASQEGNTDTPFGTDSNVLLSPLLGQAHHDAGQLCNWLRTFILGTPTYNL